MNSRSEFVDADRLHEVDHKKCPPKPAYQKTLDSVLAGVTDLRDRALIALFLTSGLQVSEMTLLNRDTITVQEEEDVTGTTQMIGRGEVAGKGGNRTVFLVDEASSLVVYAEYLASRSDDNPALFLTDQGHRMPVHTIHRALATWCMNVGYVNVHRLGVSSLTLKELMSYHSASSNEEDLKPAVSPPGRTAITRNLK